MAEDGRSGESATEDRVPRQLGRLFASRSFQETTLGRRELLMILDDLARGMEGMDRLGQAVPGAKASKKRRATASPSHPRAAAGAPPVTGNDRATSWARPTPPSEVSEWQDGPRPQGRPGDIPALPEIELPPEADRRPLPNSDLSGLPESEVIGLPPAPEVIWPENGDNLPPAPEVVWLPQGSTFRAMTDEEFAYPDLPLTGRPPADATRRLVRRTTPGGAGPDVPPAGLSGLPRVLDRTDDRIAQIARRLRDQRSGIKDYRAIIAALQERARRLRERIAAAIDMQERYAKALILDELEQRQRRLELYLEQARLELAKTYDLDTDASR
jgi:hypothetical protein